MLKYLIWAYWNYVKHHFIVVLRALQEEQEMTDKEEQEQMISYITSLFFILVTVVFPIALVVFLITTAELWFPPLLMLVFCIIILWDDIVRLLRLGGTSAPTIVGYVPMLHENMWHIIYDNYSDMPPLKQPRYPQDIQSVLVDNSTVQFKGQKTSTARLEDETVEDYQELIQDLLDSNLHPQDVYGNPIPTQLSNVRFIVRFIDEGRYYRLIVSQSVNQTNIISPDNIQPTGSNLEIQDGDFGG